MRLQAIACGLALALCLPTARAAACGNGMDEEEEAQRARRLIAQRLKAAEQHLAAGRFEEALARAKPLLASANRAVLHRARIAAGIASLRLGDFTRAQALLQDALQTEPAARISARLAEAELGLGLVPRAWARLEPLSGMGFLDADGYVALARVQLARGMRAEAEAALAQALQRAPANPRVQALQRELKAKPHA